MTDIIAPMVATKGEQEEESMTGAHFASVVEKKLPDIFLPGLQDEYPYLFSAIIFNICTVSHKKPNAEPLA